MKTLNFEQMEQVNGGGWLGCLGGLATMVIAVGAAGAIGVATGGVGWAVLSFASGWLTGGVTAAMGCGDLLRVEDEVGC